MNCVEYALTKWASDGGGIKLVTSKHWCVPHMQHEDNDSVLTEYRPFTDLPTPWHSLFGFQGEVVVVPKAVQRAPQNPMCMLLGTVFLFLLGGIWVLKRGMKWTSQALAQ